MSQNAVISIYESTFAQSDKTDAVLVVEPEEENNDDSDEDYVSPIKYARSSYGRVPQPVVAPRIQSTKLYVNKALLSYHSDYFKEVFDANSKNNEIKIEEVTYKELATLLSLIQDNPIKFEQKDAEKLIILADRFQLPAAKRHVELFLIASSLYYSAKIQIANKYDLDELLKAALLEITHINHIPDENTLKNYSEETNLKIFNRCLELVKSMR
ncbi:hypothetical protein CRE_19858 [Caenorhabditis remanei]|uniref:BTB domain-containing protein n=1 Tax=Caenorhabditis remanei TaxID=31234 RepID=E3MTA8_CAERE|nr:hypothetical protein CRE_19858 [Caenorhabditis remanei]